MFLHRLLLSAAIAIALLGTVIPSAQASVVISGTRIIYDAQSTERTIRLTNKGSSSSLVQAWLDTGAMQEDRGDTEVPFIVSPPVSRIDPDKSQTLRIMYSGEPLPADRESLFWLNVLEVPPRPDQASDQNMLQFAIRSRIKLFFRPADLSGRAGDAPARVEWALASQGGKSMLQAHNPTPFHVNLTAVEFPAGAQWGAPQQIDMLAPFETRSFPMPRDAGVSGATRLRYHFVNDHGGFTNGEATLRPAAR